MNVRLQKLSQLIRNLAGGNTENFSPETMAFLDHWRTKDGIKTLRILSASLNIASIVALFGTFYFYEQQVFLPMFSLAVITTVLSTVSLIILRRESSARLKWLRIHMYFSSFCVTIWFAFFLHFILQNYGPSRPLLMVCGLIWISVSWIIGSLETFFGSKIIVLKACLLIPPLVAFYFDSTGSILPLVVNVFIFETFIVAFFYSLNRRREDHAILELKSIDLEAKKEKLAIEAIEGELKVARDLQNSLSNPPPVQTINGYEVRIMRKSIDSFSRIWVATHRFADNRFVVAVAESSGDGVTAALVVQTLQALWTSSLYNQNWHPETWVKTVNRTLVHLSPESPHPLSLGIAYIDQNEAKTYFSGSVRCQQIQEDSIFISSGFLLSNDVKADYERMRHLWSDVKKYGEIIVHNRVDKSDLVMVTIEAAISKHDHLVTA